MTKRVLSLILALLLLLLPSALVSCGESTENTDASDVSQSQSPTADPNAGAEEETESPTPNWDAVPKTDLGGMDMNASCNPFDSNFYNVLDWDETTGDNLKDAMYNRNRFIEDQLNCRFLVVYGNAVSLMEQSVVSGLGDVDFSYALISSGGGLVQKGYLTPFNELETVDMTAPYWDQGAQRYLKLLGQMFFGFVDFGFDHYDSLAVLFYNGAILNDFHLEDPQQLFLSDEWTIDKMAAQLENVCTDLNGDGEIKLKDDLYGLVGREYWLQPYQNMSGVYLVTFDEKETKFKLHLTDENFVNVSEAIGKIYTKTNQAVNYADYDGGRIAFSDGRSLYYSRLLGDFRQLREVEDDYGVVCFPRYDYSSGDPAYFVKNPTTLFLPLVVGDDNGDSKPDFDEIGIFLQAMGAYTYDETLDVYIESTVIGKGMRDEQSANIVRIMMTNRSFDLCEAFGFHSVMDAYLSCVIADKGFGSIAQSVGKNFEKTSGKMVDEILEHVG
jgi:hypothetical protein